MIGIAKAALIVAATLALMAIGAVVFIGSGIYNIGADDHHTRIVLAVITQLRERSIDARARRITVPELKDGSRVTGGASHYAALCVACHLAPGVTKSDLRPGLYPHPPNLAQEDVLDARKAFWIIKHGIKMSAMPAWGKSLNDEAIWDIVSFVRKMPAMTPEQYQALLQTHAG
jgi:mono/diheme cytochrome c family protein